MDASAFWTIHPSADRAEVAELIRRLADELGLEGAPPLLDSTVALPPDTPRVIAALERIAPDSWRELICPP
jgi:hypothetical protein